MEAATRVSADELREVWPILSAPERVEGFQQLDSEERGDFFLELSPRGQSIVLEGLPEASRKIWIRLLR